MTRFFPRNRISRKRILTIDTDGSRPFAADWVSGACMLIRRQAFEEVGGFDEAFFLYCEDADLCQRMWNRGWKIIYYPFSTVLHLVGGSSRRRPLRSILAFHTSCYRLIRKHEIVRNPFWHPLILAGLGLRIASLGAINLCGQLTTLFVCRKGEEGEAFFDKASRKVLSRFVKGNDPL